MNVTAPAVQQVVAGEDITLQCSSVIPGTDTRWRRDSESPFIPSGLLQQVTLSQSGQYECVVIERGSGGSAIYTVISQLHVIGTKCSPINRVWHGPKLTTSLAISRPCLGLE